MISVFRSCSFYWSPLRSGCVDYVKPAPSLKPLALPTSAVDYEDGGLLSRTAPLRSDGVRITAVNAKNETVRRLKQLPINAANKPREVVQYRC